MAEKTILEKAAGKLGYGLAMAEDVAGSVKAAVGGAVASVTEALTPKKASEPLGPKERPLRKGAVKSAPKKASPKKAAKKAAAKKSPNEKIATKKGAKQPVKAAVKKTGRTKR